MKILLILAWAVVSVAILWWPRPPGFNTRWVSMPPAMSWEMLARARQSAERDDLHALQMAAVPTQLRVSLTQPHFAVFPRFPQALSFRLKNAPRVFVRATNQRTIMRAVESRALEAPEATPLRKDLRLPCPFKPLV